MPPRGEEEETRVSTGTEPACDDDKSDTTLDVSEDDLEELIGRTVREVERLMASDDGWELCSRHKDVTVRRRLSAHQSGHSYKMECLVKMPLRELSHRVHPCGPYRILWDKLLEEVIIEQVVDKDTVVAHHTMKSQLMGLIAKRDSVDIVRFSSTESSRTASFCGLNRPLLENYVRVATYPSGMKLQKTESPNVTKATVLMQSNLRLQMIPISIMESFVPGRCKTFMADLKKAAHLADDPVTPVPSEGYPGWP